MTDFDAQTLIDFVTAQRWFGSKTREVMHATVVDRAVLPDSDPELELLLVEMRFGEGTHETYQLLRCGDELDALGRPEGVRELAQLILAGASVDATEGVVDFGAVPGTADGAELRDARAIGGEQSNTSIVFD